MNLLKFQIPKKYKYLIFTGIIALIATVSCRKDEAMPAIEEDDIIVETINPAMGCSIVNISGGTKERGFGRGGYSGPFNLFNWHLNYKLSSGYQKDNIVFYPIEKKWNVSGYLAEMEEYTIIEVYDEWKHSEDWYTTSNLYRYNKVKNSAEIYKNENDTEPETIMDFNLVIGEKWFFDEVGEIGIEVIDKFEFVSNGETYPAMFVRYLSRYPTTENQILKNGYGDEGSFIVTPLNPNPIVFGDYYSDVLKPTWEIFQRDNATMPDKWIPDFSHYCSCDNYDVKIQWEFDSTSLENTSYVTYGSVKYKNPH